MLFNLWLDQPTWLVAFILAAGLGATAVLIHLATFRLPTRRPIAALAGVVAPFFGSVAILFALFTGFLANDIWERQRQASRAVLAERDALLAMGTLSIATVSDMVPIRAALRAYVEAVTGQEWAKMTDQGEAPEAEAALAEVLRQVADPRITAEAGAAAHSALLNLALRLRTARNDRLAISGAEYDAEKWAAVLALAVFTQLALGLVHLERPRAQAAALGLFTAAAVVTLGLLAVRERPFDGAHPIPPDALMNVLVAIPAAP